MASDLTIHMENRPGALAEIGETLGSAGVNIDGVFALSSGASSQAHVLVEEAAPAEAALSAAGFQVASQQEVLVMNVPDEPGVLGMVCRRAADAGLNLTVTYLATGTRLVLAADDMAALRSALAD
jgi:hypothetical protein